MNTKWQVTRVKLKRQITLMAHEHKMRDCARTSPQTNYGAPFANPDEQVYTCDLNNLVNPPFLMGQTVRRVALDAITDFIREKQWVLHAAHARSNHVHVVITGGDDPDRNMTALKARITYKLRCAGIVRQRYWTRNGSVRHIFEEHILVDRIDYVINRQGAPMSWSDGRESHYG